MKNVYKEFSHFWPEERRQVLQSLISSVEFVEYPESLDFIKTIKNPSQYIVVMNQGSSKEAASFVSAGFEHVVFRNRVDFHQEILISSLIITKPSSFTVKPLTFFLNKPTLDKNDVEISIPFYRSVEKSVVLSKLSHFMKINEHLNSIEDLALQIADELISNAFFSAVTNARGEHINSQLDRNSRIELPYHKIATLFASATKDRFMIGCEDQFGSIDKGQIMRLFKETISPEMSSPRIKEHAGAGLGIKFMIENSANFYMYCDPGKTSIVACGLLLGSLKANASAPKDFHFSFLKK